MAIAASPPNGDGGDAPVERLIRSLKEEKVSLNEYEDDEDAYHRIGRFLDDVYMTKRVRSALGHPDRV